jgi:DNA 3'-phosphatase
MIKIIIYTLSSYSQMSLSTLISSLEDKTLAAKLQSLVSENDKEKLLEEIKRLTEDEKSENENLPFIYQTKNFRYKTGSVMLFDIDDTIVTKSNVLLPFVKEILSETDETIVFVSNQKRISDAKLKARMDVISGLLPGVEFKAFLSQREDEFRKPNIGIFELIKVESGFSHSRFKCFVGDAEGRPGDHSDCDRQFAINADIPFMTSEEYFIGEADNLGRVIYFNTSDEADLLRNDLPIVIFLIGLPASGKSTFAEKFRQRVNSENSCVVINNDIMGSKSLSEYKKAVAYKTKVIVIDNLNATESARSKFQVPEGYSKAYIYFEAGISECQYRNKQRAKPVPDVVFHTFRKNLELPSFHGDKFFVYTD